MTPVLFEINLLETVERLIACAKGRAIIAEWDARFDDRDEHLARLKDLEKLRDELKRETP